MQNHIMMRWTDRDEQTSRIPRQRGLRALLLSVMVVSNLWAGRRRLSLCKQQNADKSCACARAPSAFACLMLSGLLPSTFGVR